MSERMAPPPLVSEDVDRYAGSTLAPGHSDRACDCAWSIPGPRARSLCAAGTGTRDQSVNQGSPWGDPEAARATVPGPATPTATAGCSRSSRHDCRADVQGEGGRLRARRLPPPRLNL